MAGLRSSRDGDTVRTRLTEKNARHGDAHVTRAASQHPGLSTRLFHWALVVLVATNLFLIEPEGGLATTMHLVAGYGVAGLLLFRLVWGFIGSPRSRFADFVRPWPVVGDYVARLRRLQPPRSVGHNPLGGWMVVVLLVVLVAMVVTGLFASGRQAAGALAPLIPVAATAVAGDVHEFLSNILVALIVVHLAGVAVDWLLTRENRRPQGAARRSRRPRAAAGRRRPRRGDRRRLVRVRRRADRGDGLRQRSCVAAERCRPEFPIINWRHRRRNRRA
jgi:cytochrome b